MSELQDLCGVLDSIDGDILSMAQGLHGHSQEYGRASAAAASAARSSEGEAAAALARTAAAFAAAARACGMAAGHLSASSREGQAYVRRTVGGGGASTGLSGSGSEPSGTGALDLSADGLSVSRTANGGYNLLPSNDNAGAMASELPALPGYTDVIIHANAYEFGSHSGPAVSPERLAEIIRQLPDYHGQPLRLLSCKAGELDDGAAQIVANKLGSDVLAASDTVHLARLGGKVRMAVGPNIFTPTGQWRIFKAKEKS